MLCRLFLSPTIPSELANGQFMLFVLPSYLCTYYVACCSTNVCLPGYSKKCVNRKNFNLYEKVSVTYILDIYMCTYI